MNSTPLSMQAKCFHCNDSIDTRQAYQYVKGWTKVRRKGSGINTLALLERTDRYACPACIDKLKKGLGINQMALFDIAAPDR